MRRRLLIQMVLIATVAVAGFGIPLAVAVRALYRDEALLSLSQAASEAVAAVPGSFARENDPPELPEPPSEVSVALYDSQGNRLQGIGPLVGDQIVVAAVRDESPQRDRGSLVVAYPVTDDEVVVGVIRTSIPAAVVARRTYGTWAGMALLAIGVMVGAGLLAARRSQSLSRPLADLRADADRLGAGGELPNRADTGVAEIDVIQHAIAQAATRLNESLARERSFGADLAHQFRTPLASLRLQVETRQLQAELDPELGEGFLADIDRLERTIDDVLSLGRDQQEIADPHPLASVLGETVNAWTRPFHTAGRNLVLEAQAPLPWIVARPAAVRQILDVLIDNGLAHGQGDVQISAKRVADGAVVSVSDAGTTILDSRDIFTRRHPDAAGTGIGLALARRLAEAEDLRLVLSNAGPGAEFHLVFGRTDRVRSESRNAG